MANDWENPDYDQRAAFQKAVQDLLKLDAEGCRVAKRFADAVIAYDHWFPVEPTSNYDPDRAPGDEQIDAMRALIEALVINVDLAFPLAPLAAARQKYQAELEA